MKTAQVQRLAGNIVDLHARRIFPGVVEWSGGVIRRIVPTPGRRYDRQIAPGFVDAHIHIESSMLPPSEFARLAVVHGTVATVSDPHEIANVLGLAGVDFMLRDGARSPLRFNFGVPSCVPATTFETAGAVLGPAAVARLLARPEVHYLSEFMNFPAVLKRAPEAMAKIEAARRRGKPVDGHAPGLRGAAAARYAAAGITTDHECFTLPEARDKIAAGMKILIREGSAAKNFDALAPLLRTHPDRCMFCCDDLHPDLLLRRHLDEHVRRALATGADPCDVLACASLNPVVHYGLDVGLLREGDPADLIVFTGWKNLRVRQTWVRGDLVAREGRSLLPRLPVQPANRFRARPRTADEFRVPARPSRLSVIGAVNGQLVTHHLRLRPASWPARWWRTRGATCSRSRWSTATGHARRSRLGLCAASGCARAPSPPPSHMTRTTSSQSARTTPHSPPPSISSSRTAAGWPSSAAGARRCCRCRSRD